MCFIVLFYLVSTFLFKIHLISVISKFVEQRLNASMIKFVYYNYASVKR